MNLPESRDENLRSIIRGIIDKHLSVSPLHMRFHAIHRVGSRQSFNIRIAHKPTRTLRHLLTNVKDKDDPKDRQGTVYRIRCNDCNGAYIGKTGRTLTTRLGEHQTATDKEDLTNKIAQHHRKTEHDINWDSVTCLTHSTDKDQRLTLESWFTNLQPSPLNRSRKLPAAYERLLQSEYRTADENAD